jgi:hypothetical protein
MRKKKFKLGKLPPIPPETQFDKLSPEDLYLAMEQGIANATAALGQYRSDTTETAPAHLYLANTHLSIATRALDAMIRKDEIRRMLQ